MLITSFEKQYLVILIKFLALNNIIVVHSLTCLTDSVSKMIFIIRSKSCRIISKRGIYEDVGFTLIRRFCLNNYLFF